jgi:hypothetical protein
LLATQAHAIVIPVRVRLEWALVANTNESRLLLADLGEVEFCNLLIEVLGQCINVALMFAQITLVRRRALIDWLLSTLFVN